MLLKTSLNGPGDPLTDTPEQSIETLRRMNVQRAHPAVPDPDLSDPVGLTRFENELVDVQRTGPAAFKDTFGASGDGRDEY
ncbi:hypothetical protein AB0M46_04460 [Dactylosporangium sp. NPDC051485]|uniref:hypothetical protein n=1 Tax=Dactylosporangium sp. NPDC051485 TaxID=3154846 RepID=UPI003422A42A